MKNTTRIGNIGEAAVMSTLVSNGFNVLIPLGSISDYDLVAEKQGKFYRVQCKSAQVLEGYIKFRTCTVLRSGQSRDYKGRADLFGVHANGDVYLVPVKLCGTSVCHLRTKETKNNQKKNVMTASSFILK